MTTKRVFIQIEQPKITCKSS